MVPAEVRLELAARRSEAPRGIDPSTLVDDKHRLLWHALVDPASASTRDLLRKLAPSAERDPIIAFAMARAALASPASTSTWAPVRRAIAAGPGNPLLVAVAREIAKRENVTPP